MKRALLLVLFAVLVAGCGASQAVKKPTLAAQIRTNSMWDGQVTSVRCTGHACAITENDRVDGVRPNWLGLLAEVSTLEDDDAYRSLRHVTILVTDTRRWRVAFFRCVLNHDNSPGPWKPWHPCVEQLRALA